MSELAMHEIDMLKENLAERAAAEGLIDVSYRLVDSPLGQLMLAATERGIVRVAFDSEDFDAVLGSLAQKVGVRVLHRAAPLDAAATQLDEYFAHSRTGSSFAWTTGSAAATGWKSSWRCRASATATPPATRRWPR